MMNIKNIRDTISKSPKLYFISRSNVKQHLGDGLGSSMTIKKESLVDYEGKAAKIITETAVLDYSQIVKEYYENGRKRTVVEGEIDETSHNASWVEVPALEYEQLFSEKGELRPVPFDTLVENENASNQDNVLTFNIIPKEDKLENDVKFDSSLIMSLNSEDVLHIDSLGSSFIDNTMTLTDMEMIIYIGDKREIVF